MRLPCFSRSQLGVILLLGAALWLLWAWRANFGGGGLQSSLPSSPHPVFVEVTGAAGVAGVYAFDHSPTLAEIWHQGRAPGAAPDYPDKITSGSLVTITPDGRFLLGRMAGARLLTLGLPIDLNTASAADLTALPGVGPALAQAIVAYRTTHGPFKKVDDLEKVPGIGPKKLEKIKPNLITNQ